MFIEDVHGFPGNNGVDLEGGEEHGLEMLGGRVGEK